MIWTALQIILIVIAIPIVAPAFLVGLVARIIVASVINGWEFIETFLKFVIEMRKQSSNLNVHKKNRVLW